MARRGKRWRDKRTAASRWAASGLLVLAFALAPAGAQPPPQAATALDEGEDEALQQRLTEREDKRRPRDPISVDVAGRPLVLGGEVELEAGLLRPYRAVDAPGRDDRALLELGLEAEAFYSVGKPLSVFAQLRLAAEEDLRVGDYMQISERYLERGEMWLYSEDIGGSGIDLDLGRLDFEDDRRWWWDEELDAVRIAFEGERVEFALAFARELGPNRSDRDFVDPEHDRVQRLIAEASWDWAPNHALQLFALRQRDRSRSESPGRTVAAEREDESDARLTWLGARAIGAVEFRRAGIVGYWLDAARVRGTERLAEYQALTPRQSEVVVVTQHRVRGHALDAGLTWLLPLAGEPRLFAGVAFGSGDAAVDDAGDDRDRGFRQTTLHANEAGFGGVQRYPHYGVLLAPQLANLRVDTVGAGLSLLRASSLDVVYHRYRLHHPAESLRDARLELELDAVHRDLGSALDLVLAVEEWERVEFFGVLSGFRAGRAVAAGDGAWSYGAVFAMRIAF
ncbi:alginate export family protein [Lysobacter koreensis]|uniref:Alginate export family protein n=1 Tax=Lysobacter koreensis TaxID=266122 RepID=A0ABW2YKH3_9GAMM